MRENGAFGVWSAALLGVGAMVGAGIFIVIGQAGAIAGNLVWLSFVLGGLLSLAAGYSLVRLALAFPSRGGVVEYLVQLYGEGPFSGAMGVLFYLAQVVGIVAVAKAFGVYGVRLFGWPDAFASWLAVGIVGLFALINGLGAVWVSRSESVIVAVKLVMLVAFTAVALVYMDPSRLTLAQAPPLTGVLFAVGLTFFAYQGFSLICNTVEDMADPRHALPRAVMLAIGLVMGLYVAISLAVLGNLPLETVVRTQDYALAEAARPVFGEWGFRVMAVAALIATASAINATLYAATEINYVLIKEGALPAPHRFHRFESKEALWVTAALTLPLIVWLDLSGVTLLAALSVLVIQGVVHLGHFFQRERTGARGVWVALAAAGMFMVAALTVDYSLRDHPWLAAQLLGMMGLALLTEMVLYHGRGRRLQKQSR